MNRSGEIFIQGLSIDALIGVCDSERTQRQPLVFDVVLGCELETAGASDRLADSIDYAEVTAVIREFVESRADLLLERLAFELCNLLLARFGPSRVELRVSKPEAAKALGCADVGLRVRMGC